MFAGLEEAVGRRAIVPGEYRLQGALRYQACNEAVCLEPRVERFELPNLGALNFLLHGALGGGGTLSLMTDAQGKTFSTALLRMEIEVDE